MPRAVRFDEYGGIDVLRVEEVERPAPGSGQVLVRTKAAGINPGKAAIREGAFADVWPADRRCRTSESRRITAVIPHNGA